MKKQLNTELHKILLQLAKRVDCKHLVWFNCSLAPKKNDPWFCFICQKEFSFNESVLEIHEHGFQHLSDRNLLPFI